MEMPTFPYEPREFQFQIMEEIDTVLQEGSDLIMESGTGTGKTIASLAPVINFALKNGKRVVYLTRTNSQETQVILELREIMGKLRSSGDDLLEGFIPGIGLQGRKNMCCMVGLDPEFEECSSEELSRLCNQLKRNTKSSMIGSTMKGQHASQRSPMSNKKVAKVCPFYENTMAADINPIIEMVRTRIPTPEEFIPEMKAADLCPYELNKTMLERSLVISAPYIYLFDPGLCHHFLEWIGASMEDLILIIDEAHNLPNYARELVSMELSSLSLDRAQAEAKEFGVDGVLKILGNVGIPVITEMLKDIMKQLEDEYVLEDDGLVPPYELEEEIMHRMKITSNKLKLAIGELINHGLAIQDERLKNGRLPRSYIHAMGHFLLWWVEMESSRYIKLIKGGENISLELFCMDPSKVIEIVRKAHSSIHLSGTLRPLDEYRISTGLPLKTRMRIFPSPFPPENRMVLYLSRVTTRYEDLNLNMISKLLEVTLSICNGSQRNTMVFFPSFKLMERFLESGFSFSLKRHLFVEEQGQLQSTLMAMVDDFKQRGGIFLSVMGGRLSEGMDFPADYLEVVILEGIPYPKPTARQRALQHYYEVRFGKGWDFTVKAPTTRKLLQSIGRLIRTETDQGVAIILDKRAVHFREDIPDLRESLDPVLDIKKFFNTNDSLLI